MPRGADQIGNSRLLKAMEISPTHELYNIDAHNIYPGAGEIDSCIYHMHVYNIHCLDYHRGGGVWHVRRLTGMELDLMCQDSRDPSREIWLSKILGGRVVAGQKGRSSRNEKKAGGNTVVMSLDAPHYGSSRRLYFFVRWPPTHSTSSLLLSPFFFLFILFLSMIRQ